MKWLENGPSSTCGRVGWPLDHNHIAPTHACMYHTWHVCYDDSFVFSAMDTDSS